MRRTDGRFSRWTDQIVDHHAGAALAAETLGVRSQTTVSAASFSATSDFKALGLYRQPQLPSIREGVFIRVSLSSPRASCNGMTASFATEAKAARMNAQCIPSFTSPM